MGNTPKYEGSYYKSLLVNEVILRQTRKGKEVNN